MCSAACYSACRSSARWLTRTCSLSHRRARSNLRQISDAARHSSGFHVSPESHSAWPSTGARAQISDAAWSPAGESRDRPARRGDAGGDCALPTPSIIEWRVHSWTRVHARQMRDEMGWTSTSEGELAAFVAYAQASQSVTQSVARNRHRGVQAHAVAPITRRAGVPVQLHRTGGHV